MTYLGDFSEDSTIDFPFTSSDGSGGAVAPSSAFEAADLVIYKANSATQKVTTNGVSMQSPFDAVVGLHHARMDTSVDTGDVGFWAAGNDYFVALVPDETVDSQTVVAVVAHFSIENRNNKASVVSIAANVINAASIAASALNGKGDWNIGKAGYSLAATGLDAISSTAAGMVEIAKAVWDRVTSKANHDIAQSAGKQLRTVASVVIRSDTAQGPGTGNNQIQFDTGASATDGAYDPARVAIIAGTGDGQSRNILQYDGASKTATVDRNWKVNPDATSEFNIISDAGREHVNEGLAQGGTSTTITLNALASSNNAAYPGQLVFLRSGTGEDQAKLVLSYDGSTKIATVNGAFSPIPDTTTGYVMLPTSPVLLSTATQASIDAIPAVVNAEVLDVMTVDTFVELGAVPAATSSIKDKLTWLFMLARNKGLQTNTTKTLRDDGDTTDVATSAVSSDGTTFIRDKYS